MSLTATIAMPTDMNMKSASSAHSHICLEDLGLSGWFIGPFSFHARALRSPIGADTLLDDSKVTDSWQSQTSFPIGSVPDFTCGLALLCTKSEWGVSRRPAKRLFFLLRRLRGLRETSVSFCAKPSLHREISVPVELFP